MTEYRDHLQCPLCQGRGEVRRSELIEFSSDPELKAKINASLGCPADSGRHRRIGRRTEPGAPRFSEGSSQLEPSGTYLAKES